MAVWVAGTGRFGGPRVSLCEDGLAQWRCEWGAGWWFGLVARGCARIGSHSGGQRDG